MVCFKSCFTAFKHHRNRNQYLVAPSNSPRDKAGHGGTQLLLEMDIPNKRPIPEQPINHHHVSPESKEKVEEEEARRRSSCNVVKKAAFETTKVEEAHQLSLLPAQEEVGNVGKVGGEMEERADGGESKANVAVPRSSSQEQIVDGEEESEGGSYERVMEESSESLFSISIGKNHAADSSEKEEEITSPIPKCNPSHNPSKVLGENVSVLNPVEDTTTTQLKSAAAAAGKARRQQQHYQEDKENISTDINIERCPSPEFSFNTLIKKPQQGTNANKDKEQDDVIAVDASLSDWVAFEQPKETGDRSSAGHSPKKRKEDKKVVLGALTIGVLKQVAATANTTTSPAKSRSQRFGGTSAIGTVGSYWKHSGGSVEL